MVITQSHRETWYGVYAHICLGRQLGRLWNESTHKVFLFGILIHHSYSVEVDGYCPLLYYSSAWREYEIVFFS